MLLMCTLCGNVSRPEDWAKLDCPGCGAPAYDACQSLPIGDVLFDAEAGRYVFKKAAGYGLRV